MDITLARNEAAAWCLCSFPLDKPFLSQFSPIFYPCNKHRIRLPLAQAYGVYKNLNSVFLFLEFLEWTPENK